MINIVILINKESFEKDGLMLAIDKSSDFSYTLINEKRCFFVTENGQKQLYYKNQPVKASDYDAIYSGAVSKGKLHYSILRFFESRGVIPVQTSAGLANSSNKDVTYLYFSRNNIKYPIGITIPNGFMSDNLDAFHSILKEKIGDYPYIIKPVSGSLGNGVELVRNDEELFRYITKDPEKNHIIQEYISPDNRQDERHIVVGDKVVNSMLRTARQGSVTTNIAKGAIGTPLVCDKETEELCVKACKAVKIEFGGVDVIRKEDGTPCVLEVNPIPGQHIIKVTGHNHFEDVLEYIKAKVEKKNA